MMKMVCNVALSHWLQVHANVKVTNRGYKLSFSRTTIYRTRVEMSCL